MDPDENQENQDDAPAGEIPEKYRGIGPRIDFANASIMQGKTPDFIKDELIMQGMDEDLAGKVVATVVEGKRLHDLHLRTIYVGVFLFLLGLFLNFILARFLGHDPGSRSILIATDLGLGLGLIGIILIIVGAIRYRLSPGRFMSKHVAEKRPH
jgi:hypothetical protein